MARKITEEDIKLINEAYLQFGTYAAAARVVGCAPSTVKKYIVDGYQINPQKSDYGVIEFAPIDKVVEYLKNNSSLSCITPKEKRDLKEIWKGMNF